MNKRNLLIAGGIIVVFGIGLYVTTSFSNKKTSVKQQSQKENTQIISPSIHTKKYIDESGFTFLYPEDIIVTKNKTDDKVTYSDVSLTSSKVSGGITLRVLDTPFKSSDSWLQKNEKTAALGLVTDIKLGSIPAKEISTKDKITAGAIDQGILFTIEVSLDNQKDFWENIYRTLSSSFSFASPASSGTSASPESASGTSDVLLEGEESVE